MKLILGIVKICASVIVVLGLANSFSRIVRRFDVANGSVAIVCILFIGVLYLYYLIQTGIWNLEKKQYKNHPFLLPGLLIHFIILIWIMRYGSQFSKTLLFITVPLVLLGIFIGVFDIITFYTSWKNKPALH